MGLEAAIIGGTIGSALIGSRSARRASQAQQSSADASIAEQRRQLNVLRGDVAPFREAGVGAVNQLGQLFGGDMSQFQTSPDYLFRKDQGLQGIAQTLGAGGQGAFSGNALRGLNESNSNLASGEFGNFINRRLALAGLGGQAASLSGQAAQNTGVNVGNALMQQGNARASGILGQGVGINQGINGIMQALMLQNMGLLGGGGGGGGGR
ncbi:MAG: hypothetical protein GY927_10960 [bacterium]|nr:hypothetical protein [bacterium]